MLKRISGTVSLLLCTILVVGAAAQAQTQNEEESQARLSAQQQQQVRRMMRQMGGQRRPLAECIEVGRINDIFPTSRELRMTSHLSRELLTIKFSDDTRVYLDEMVPVGELSVGDTIVVEGAPTTMLVRRMFSQEEGAVRRISNAVERNLTEQDKESYDVAPFPDPPETNVAVKGTITSLEPLTLTTDDGINIQLIVAEQTEMLRMKEASYDDIEQRNDVIVVGKPEKDGDGWAAEIVYKGDPRRVIDLFIRDIIRPKAMDIPRRGR